MSWREHAKTLTAEQREAFLRGRSKYAAHRRSSPFGRGADPGRALQRARKKAARQRRKFLRRKRA